MPSVRIGRVQQLARVCDGREVIVVFLFGYRVWEVPGRIDITVQDVYDAVACFLASVVRRENGCDVGMVRETDFLVSYLP